MNRRKFLQIGASTVAFSVLHPSGYAADLADQKKRVGLIGSGWYGKSDLLRLVQVAPVEVVSLCDVDKNMLAGAAEIVATRQASKRKPRTYADYREMLKEKDLDIVLIGTPDHWHALTMIAAVEAGADVYVQKPISVDVIEGQAMLAAARKHDRVVQVGTQRRSTPHLIEARDNIVREGKLGNVGLVEIYSYYGMSKGPDPEDSQPPNYLDWDMWTGPAPMLPYNRMKHPRGWRSWMEYGNGTVGDLCIHMLDTARWMLDLGAPRSISSAGGIIMAKGRKGNIADTQTATFDFGELQVVWQHRRWGDSPDPKYPWGITFYGDKGTLKASIHYYDFTSRVGGKPMHGDALMEYEKYPEDRDEKELEKDVASAIRGHMRDFLGAIAKRSKPVADIEQGYISTSACILANISMKLGRSVAWDATKGRVIGDDEANRLLERAYRSPWVHPQV
ncbi:MAG: oxidoreductase [Verrucomicrobia bacterium]|nr:MAG: oxidoreductase [Verrucomicrobiota bacterium]